MSKSIMPRISEIRALLTDPEASDSLFRDFDASIADNAIKRKFFNDIEAELIGLDDEAWNFLKREVAPLFGRRNSQRGWEAAFDKLNQAKAYNYLSRIGGTKIEFIPESSISGVKSPDLQAMSGLTRILCEVKTINPSDVATLARKDGSVREIQNYLPPQFFEKLRSTLAVAKRQMEVYYSGDAMRIVYVILNFDDNLHEYIENYGPQLQEFARSVADGGLEIVFDIKPKFYSATS